MSKRTKSVQPAPESSQTKGKLGAGSILAFILLLAFFLRVWGFDWGLSATHFGSYHPDENRLLLVIMDHNHMDLLHGKFLPYFYNYPSLQIFFFSLAVTIAYVFNIVNIASLDLHQIGLIIQIGRIITIIMGTATIWAVYAAGRQLWGVQAGIIAAILMAVIPLHAQHSHWVTVDVPATFWISLSLLWAIKLRNALVKDDNGKKTVLKSAIIAAICAGLFAGLAAATKYNAVLVILSALVAIGRPQKEGFLRVKEWCIISAVTIACMLIGYIIACPGTFLENARFMHDIAFEAKHVSQQPGDTYEQTGSGYIYHIIVNLSSGMGWPMLLFSIVSIFYALYRRQRGDGMLAAFAFPYYFLIGLAAVRYSRYVIPLLPFLALWSARLIADLARVPSRSFRTVAYAAASVLTVYTGIVSLLLIHLMTITDPRDQAYDWLKRNNMLTATYGFAGMPWFQTPPLNPYFSYPGRGQWTNPQLALSDERDRYLYFGKDWDLETLDQKQPQVVLLSEYDYRDALRLKKSDAQTYIKTLKETYRRAFVCGGNCRRPALSPAGLPHDMSYTYPATWVFVRK